MKAHVGSGTGAAEASAETALPRRRRRRPLHHSPRSLGDFAPGDALGALLTAALEPAFNAPPWRSASVACS